MSAVERVGVLLLGCGRAAQLHSRVLRRLPGVDLHFASRDWARGQELAAQYGGKALGTYEEGLDASSIDVAIVATPTSTHLELALLALQARKHVIVEKPAFMRANDAMRVASAARAAGRRVFVAENYFYKPITEHLRWIARSGHIGEVRFVTINATKRQLPVGWRADPDLSGGGALFEGGVHWINFASNIGLDVRSVSARAVGQPGGADRSSLVVFEYEQGGVGTLAHSWELAAPFGHLRISKMQGTKGAVTFESNGLLHVTTGRRPSVGVSLRDPFGYRAMHKDFLRAIREAREPRFTLDMAGRDLELLEQAEGSMVSSSAAPSFRA